jgi:hypothetical protein
MALPPYPPPVTAGYLPVMIYVSGAGVFSTYSASITSTTSATTPTIHRVRVVILPTLLLLSRRCTCRRL